MKKVNGAPGQPPLQPAEFPAQGIRYVLGEGWGEGGALWIPQSTFRLHEHLILQMLG